MTTTSFRPGSIPIVTSKENIDKAVGGIHSLMAKPYDWNNLGALPARPEAIEFACGLLKSGSVNLAGVQLSKIVLLPNGVPALEISSVRSRRSVEISFPTQRYVAWKRVLGGQTTIEGVCVINTFDVKDDGIERLNSILELTRKS